MHWIRLLLTATALQVVAACSLLEEKPAPAPPPQAAPAPAPVRQPGDDLPYRPLPQAAPRPVAKPPAATTTAKPAKPAQSRPEVKPAASAEAGNEEFVPRTEELAPVRPPPSRQATKKPTAVSMPRNEPEWLQGCSARQQSGGAVLCDANSLLTQPSAKVQVYTREPSLARSTPSGPILLRESLPKLYRFFVLP